MVEQFIGKWKMTSSDNFDEYMKAVGKIHSFILNYVLLLCILLMSGGSFLSSCISSSVVIPVMPLSVLQAKAVRQSFCICTQVLVLLLGRWLT